MTAEIPTYLKIFLFTAGSIMYALCSFLPQMSKVNGKLTYEPGAATCVTDLVKMAIALSFLTKEANSQNPMTIVAKLANDVFNMEFFFILLSMFVPTALYSINNNLDVVLADHMDGVTCQVLLQNKILSTGILWWIVFNKPLEVKQWLSLVLLTIGSSIIAYSSSKQELHAKEDASSTIHVTKLGLLLILVYCFCSASASICLEWVYKKGKKASMHKQNLAMYIVGMSCNFSQYVYAKRRVENALSPNVFFATFFNGWNVWTIAFCVNQALMGMVLGVVMKYFSNIHKILIFGSSMYASAFLNYVVFGLKYNSTFILGLLVITASILLYNYTQLVAHFLGGTSQVGKDEKKTS